jgi:hypothetical protein
MSAQEGPHFVRLYVTKTKVMGAGQGCHGVPSLSGTDTHCTEPFLPYHTRTGGVCTLMGLITKIQPGTSHVEYVWWHHWLLSSCPPSSVLPHADPTRCQLIAQLLDSFM